MAAVIICSDFGAQENKVCQFPLFIHWFAMQWWDWMPWSLFFECWSLSQFFHSPLSPLSRGSLVLLCFLLLGWCHLHIWGYWYFSQQSWFQLGLHPAWRFTDVLCFKVKQAGWQHAALLYSFPNLEPAQSCVFSFNCCFLTCKQISQKAGKMVWYSHLCKFYTFCCDPHSQRLLHGQ